VVAAKILGTLELHIKIFIPNGLVGVFGLFLGLQGNFPLQNIQNIGVRYQNIENKGVIVLFLNRFWGKMELIPPKY
jgi:hypothetical protein